MTLRFLAAALVVSLLVIAVLIAFASETGDQFPQVTTDTAGPAVPYEEKP